MEEGDVNETLGELERRLKELERELEAVGRTGETATEPAQGATPPGPPPGTTPFTAAWSGGASAGAPPEPPPAFSGTPAVPVRPPYWQPVAPPGGQPAPAGEQPGPDQAQAAAAEAQPSPPGEAPRAQAPPTEASPAPPQPSTPGDARASAPAPSPPADAEEPPQPAAPTAATEGLHRQLDELLAFRERLVASTNELVAELSRVLSDLGVEVDAAEPGEPDPAETVFDGELVVEAGRFADLATLAAFEQALQRTDGVASAHVRSLEDGHAVVDVALEEPTRLAAALRERAVVAFAVREAGEGRLALAIEAGGEPG